MYKIHSKLVFLKKLTKKKLNTLKKNKKKYSRSASEQCKKSALFMNSASFCTVHVNCTVH